MSSLAYVGLPFSNDGLDSFGRIYNCPDYDYILWTMNLSVSSLLVLNR